MTIRSNFMFMETLIRLLFPFLILCLATHNSNSQESNLQAIKEITIEGDKESIEKGLIGTWSFVRIEYQNESDKNIVPDVSRPDVVFNEDYTYEIQSEINPEVGVWSYDDIEGFLELEFSEPKWSLPVNKMSDELISQMQNQGLLNKVEGNSWIINNISDSELRIIEFLAMDETQLNYVLLLYQRN